LVGEVAGLYLIPECKGGVMKKVWDITVSDTISAEIQKKIKKILRPSSGPGISHYGPQKCLFCEELTTWIINDKPVCPKCAVRYNFLSELYLLDPCEVCGKQGEWCTDYRDPPQHFLCYHHREKWFHWSVPELEAIDSKKEPEKWKQAWGEGWARFVKHEKALQSPVR
jgi:hypothetical protein